MSKSIVEVLEEIENTQGTIAKRQILEEYAAEPELRQALRLALDPYIVFNVGKYKAPKQHADEPSAKGFHRLLLLLHDLDTTELRGGVAKAKLDEAFEELTELEQKWGIRILLKKTRLGIAETVVNEVMPGCIRTYEVALCETLKVEFEQLKESKFPKMYRGFLDQAKAENIRVLRTDDAKVYWLVVGKDVTKVTFKGDIAFPTYVQGKWDGLRCGAEKRSGVVTMKTRNGNVIETLPHIKKILEECTDFDDVYLDGEAMGEDWNESASVIGSTKNAKDLSGMNYHLFSVLPLDEWDTKNFVTPYSEQHLDANNVAALCDSKHIQSMPIKIANDYYEFLVLYLEFLDQDLEGVIGKHANGVYVLGKTKEGWFKFKPEQTYEGSVVGWFKGTTGGKRENSFAGFWILLENGVATRVGSGFTDPDKAEYDFEIQNGGGIEVYFGRILECTAQPPLTDEGKMRFPRPARDKKSKEKVKPLKWRSPKDVDPKVIKAYDAWAVTKRPYPIERRKGDE